MRTAPRTVALATLLVLVQLGPARAAGAVATLPAGFVDELVVGVGAPTALAFTPDERLLVTTQPGRVRLLAGGTLSTAIDLSAVTCSNSERGLLGIAVDPAFGSNGHVYLYYTRNKSGTCVNRVSRFAMTGDTIAAGTELLLLDDIPSTAGNHNAGDLHFGKDGYLYVTVGDGGCDYLGDSGCGGSNDAARDRNTLLGKVLRIGSDGTIPPTNPFLGSGTARCNTGNAAAGLVCQETYAWGLRNPFRFAFDPNQTATVFYVNDVGQNTWEEIDLGAPGADYGWNAREGHCAGGSTTDCGGPPAGMTNPIHHYGHSTGCRSITGGAFVPNGAWTSAYDGTYLFSDFVCGRIFQLVPDGAGGFTSQVFVDGLGSSSAVHLAFGPSPAGQALYYTTYANGGEVHRIVFAGSNRVPTATFTASPSAGPAPLIVSFDAGASSDPDNDALTYRWDFGDGQGDETDTPTTAHAYAAAGSYTATLRVRDEGGLSSAVATRTITVGKNDPPVPKISSPKAGKQFAVGDRITLKGSAKDPEDGNLPGSALTWTVTLHHDTHTHPYLGPVSGTRIAFTTPAPEDVQAAETSYLEISLTATDSAGAAATVTRRLDPKKISLTFITDPGGFLVTVNGTPLTSPATVTSWSRWPVTVDAPDQSGYHWVGWSNRGARTHTITTAGRKTYKASFAPN